MALFHSQTRRHKITQFIYEIYALLLQKQYVFKQHAAWCYLVEVLCLSMQMMTIRAIDRPSQPFHRLNLPYTKH